MCVYVCVCVYKVESNGQLLLCRGLKSLQYVVPAVTYLLTYLRMYSMEQSLSWQANQFSATQEIPCILWNPKVPYRICKCLPPVPVVSQISPVCIPHPTS